MRLVSIDTKEHIYTLYEGRAMLDKVQSNKPLTAEMVEVFRTEELDDDYFEDNPDSA